MRRNRTDYAINRYYSPDTGRFTTHDPLTELDRPERLNRPQGLNLYPYVMGAPTRYTDPDGRDWGVPRQASSSGTAARPEYFEGTVRGDYIALPDGYTYYSVESFRWFRLDKNDPVGHDIAAEEAAREFAKSLEIPPPPAEPGTETSAEPDFIDAFNDAVEGAICSAFDEFVCKPFRRGMMSPDEMMQDFARETEEKRRQTEQTLFALRTYGWAAQNPSEMISIYAHTPDAELQRIFGGASGTAFVTLAPFAVGGAASGPRSLGNQKLLPPGIALGEATPNPIGARGAFNLPVSVSKERFFAETGLNWLTPEEFAAMPSAGEMNPWRIRFAQNSAGRYFTDAQFGEVFDLAASLRNQTVNLREVQIRIVLREGKVYSLDHRRHYAFQLADVPFRYVKLDHVPRRHEFKFTTDIDGVDIPLVHNKPKMDGSE